MDWRGDITALYREKAKNRHPDSGGSDTLMAELNRHGSPASHSPQLSLHIGSPCLYCDEPIDVPTRDHIYPRVLGGRSDKKNIVIVCQKCNQDKGDLPLF